MGAVRHEIRARSAKKLFEQIAEKRAADNS
jgi:hypothetical protein